MSFDKLDKLCDNNLTDSLYPTKMDSGIGSQGPKGYNLHDHMVENQS